MSTKLHGKLHGTSTFMLKGGSLVAWWGWWCWRL